MAMKPDPVMREILKIKEQMSAELERDFEGVMERYRQFARDHAERMARPRPKRLKPKPSPVVAPDAETGK